MLASLERTPALRYLHKMYLWRQHRAARCRPVLSVRSGNPPSTGAK